MKFGNARLCVFIASGIAAGCLAYWGSARYPRAAETNDVVAEMSNAEAPSNASSTMPPAKDGDGTRAEATSSRDEIFKIFPEEKWIQVPRGLMEHGHSGLDSFLFVLDGDGEDELVFLRAMIPGASEPTVQAIAHLIMELSRDWVQLATESLQRSGPHEWQVNLPPGRVASLREDFERNLRNSVGPGYAHLVGVLAYKPLAILGAPSMRLTFDSSSNLWFLAHKRGTHTISEENSLELNAPVRLLLERAGSLRGAKPADATRQQATQQGATGQTDSHATSGQAHARSAQSSKPTEGNPDPQTLMGQIHTSDALQHSQEVWMPVHVARSFSYSIGSLSTTYEMDEEAQVVLGLNDFTRRDLEAATSNLLAQIRELESQKVELVENTDDLIHIKIPAGFAPQSLLKEYQTQMEETLGPVRADIFLPRLSFHLLEVTTAFTDSDRHIRISPAEGVGIKIEVRQNDRTMGTGDSGLTVKKWWSNPSECFVHLVQALRDKGFE